MRSSGLWVISRNNSFKPRESGSSNILRSPNRLHLLSGESSGLFRKGNLRVRARASIGNSPGLTGARKNQSLTSGMFFSKAGNRPAITTLDLPDPLGPTTIMQRGTWLSWRSSLRISLTCSIILRMRFSRPKKDHLSSYPNACKPL